MRKEILLLIFLILLDNALAIAATPPALEFYGDEQKSLIVFNTNDFSTRFMVEPEEGFIFSQNEFMLAARSRNVMNITARNAGKKEGVIYIREIALPSKGLGLENGIGIKYKIHKKDAFSKITSAALNMQDKMINRRSTTIIAIILIAIILVVFYKKRKKEEMP